MKSALRIEVVDAFPGVKGLSLTMHQDGSVLSFETCPEAARDMARVMAEFADAADAGKQPRFEEWARVDGFGSA